MALAEGKRGLPQTSKGQQVNVTLDDYGGFLVSENMPRYYPQNYNNGVGGLLFHFSSGSITAGATNLSPLPAGTAAPAVALWNPVGSGKNLIIAKVFAGTVSGTPAGPIVWNYGNFTNLTTGTQSTAVAGIVGSAAGPVAKVFSGNATTGSVLGIFYKHAAELSAVTAVGSANGTPAWEDVGGDIIVPPGTWLALASFGTGTSHVFQAGVTWIEAPI